MPTQVQIVAANGDGSVSTITIPIPPGVDVEALVQAISKVGAWDSARANYFPSASIRKITPQ